MTRDHDRTTEIQDMLTAIDHGATAEIPDHPVVQRALVGLWEQPVRSTVVRRIGSQLRTGQYDPPVESVVDRILGALLPSPRR